MRPLLRNRSAHANPPPDGFFALRDARLHSDATRTMTTRTQIATITVKGSVSRLVISKCVNRESGISRQSGPAGKAAVTLPQTDRTRGGRESDGASGSVQPLHLLTLLRGEIRCEHYHKARLVLDHLRLR